MEMTVHCPSCNQELAVPIGASGRKARCPMCSGRFWIPEGKDLMDETVIGWINPGDADVTVEDETEEEMEAPVEAVPPTKTGPEATPAREAMPMAPQRPRRLTDGERAFKEAARHGSYVAEGELARLAAEAEARSKADAEKNAPTSEETTEAPQAAMGQLDVLRIGTNGVEIRFNSHLLEDLIFRGSMPIRCVVCARGGLYEQTDDLIARPIIWQIKGRDSVDRGELTQRYELRLRGQRTGRQVIAAMRPMDELPPPMTNPMPYYVCTKCGPRVTLRGETYSLPTGLMCEMTIPRGAYAMEWVGLINSVRDSGYIYLEEQLQIMEQEAWRAVPQHIRDRLSVWFTLQADERFLAYLIDADFGRSDAGLAGLIITDKRLVYCRFHQHGQVHLDAPGIVQVTDRGGFMELDCRHGDHYRAMVRLRPAEMEQMQHLLEQLGSPVKLQVARSLQ